jgi:hypothetical protein
MGLPVSLSARIWREGSELGSLGRLAARDQQSS